MQTEICLGTAQFGLSYGITNHLGQVSQSTVRQILEKLSESGISWIDTAQAYGNSEESIGNSLPFNHAFKFISKLSPQSCEAYSYTDIERWEKSFQSTCRNLKVKSIESFLIHSPRDLQKLGSSHLEKWLISLRQRSLVKRLGISIYSNSDLNHLNLDFFDMVQVPLSVYDQRMLNDGTINLLHERGIKVHVRSVFLQGLLLLPSSSWPNWINSKARDHHKSFEELALTKQCELLDLAIGFVKAQKNIEAVVIGLCNLPQLQQLLRVWNTVSLWDGKEWEKWRLDNNSIVNPREWPTK
jgi:aryl-alcohol dehydrogenase-like predicted oxidoreductase